MAWTSGIKWIVQVLTWGVTILVMRLLTPEDYGLVGMAALFLGVVILISEGGLGAAVVALRTLSQRQIAQLNSVAVLVGLIAMALCAAAANPVGAFFESTRLPSVILVLSITFVISGFNTVPTALLRRDLRYRALALVEAAQAIGDVTVTLILAWLGFGYWSLVLGRMTKFVVAAVAFTFVQGRTFALPRFGEIREALRFGSHVIADRLAWYTYSNADYLIVGKLLGEGPLGLYNSAFALSRMPVQKISGMVTRVSPGIFSAVQNDAAALRRYIRILTEGISIVTFAPILGLGLVAREMIPVVLGERWIGAVVALQILSVGAAFGAVTPLLPQVLHVIRETRFMMQRSIVAALVFIPAFLFGSRWGIAGVALAWVLLEPLLVALPVLIKIRQKIGLSLREYGSALWPAVSGGLVMAASVLAIRAYLENRLATPAVLGVEVGVGALAYIGFLLTIHRSRISRLYGAVRLLRS